MNNGCETTNSSTLVASKSWYELGIRLPLHNTHLSQSLHLRGRKLGNEFYDWETIKTGDADSTAYFHSESMLLPSRCRNTDLATSGRFDSGGPAASCLSEKQRALTWPQLLQLAEQHESSFFICAERLAHADSDNSPPPPNVVEVASY